MSRRERSMVPDATPVSYYGRPVVKEPVWRWPIGGYLFTGGVAAGSSLLALGAALTGDRALARQSRLVSVTAVGISGGLLIHDLGRPARFLHMLRVVKPTSPMNMGTWLLSLFGSAAGVAAVADHLPRGRCAGRTADLVAAAAAPALATYTAVLLADTAIPIWHEARKELPFLFAAGAAAGAGGIATLLPAGRAPAARRVALAGAVAELAARRWMEAGLGELAEPYHQGRAGRLQKAATGFTAAGAAVLALAGRRHRRVSAAGGAMVATGALLERYAVIEAGRQSARDPKYTIAPQRRRIT